MNAMATSFLRNLSTSIIGAVFIALGTTAISPSHATTISDNSTFGNTMAGMSVTADFVGGGSQTVTWGVTGSQAGGAFGTDWSLTEIGDTFSQPWTFSNSGQSITSLVINAIPGNTTFDTIDTLVEPPNTPGSGRGISFYVLAGLAPASFAYSNPIDISQGDLFGTLSLSYSQGFTGKLNFLATTDSGTPDDPVTAAVPEPSSMSTVVVGAFGTGLLLLRRHKH